MNKNRLWKITLILSLALIAVTAWLIIQSQRGKTVVEQGSDSGSASKKQYTVTFYSNDGTVLKIDSVAEGNTANPPMQPQMLYGTVFQSWDTDISSVTKDLKVCPICEDVKEKMNIFAIEGTYGKSGGTVIVPVRLCGNVCVSAFDLTISYDSNALELVSVTEDGAVLFNSEVPGKIRLNYVSTDNTVADVDICFLKFFVKVPSGEIPVSLEMQSIYTCKDSLESDNDDLYVPEYAILNGTVYVLSGEE